jgi:hypothetical protein
VDGFIVPDGVGAVFVESEKRGESEIVESSDTDVNTTLYYVTPPLPGSASEVEERRALTRLPIFAIFHGITHELGVPPSFTGSLSTLISRSYQFL